MTTASSLLVMSGNAALVSQYGILDLTANGGINPNTGEAWKEGDQYRLAFFTATKIDGTSSDPAVYDDFATEQAQQNPALASSTNWTAMVYVATDESLPQVDSPISNPRERSGTLDVTGGNGIGGAGVPVFAMDGKTAIARNNADIYDGWSNPFEGNATLRLASGSTNNNSAGDPVVAIGAVHYSPFLNQFGLGDTANNHGVDVWTGGFGTAVNPLGLSVDPDGLIRGSHGSSNANNAERTWNRFQSVTTAQLAVYALSEPLTVRLAIPDNLDLRVAVSSTNGSALDFEWDSQEGMVYDLLSSLDLSLSVETWTPYDPEGDGAYENLQAAVGAVTSLTTVPQDGQVRFFAVKRKAPVAPEE